MARFTDVNKEYGNEWNAPNRTPGDCRLHDQS
jgi:hypothetical protein